MKRLLCYLLSLTLLPVMARADEYDFVYDGIYYQYNYDKTELRVVGEFMDPNLYTGDIVVPDFVNSPRGPLPVTSIGIHAFSHSSITSISLPSTLLEILNDAFYNCDKLESVVIPDGVVSVDGCFGNCDNLKSVVFPEKMGKSPYGGPSLGGGMFQDCKNLEYVRLPDDLTEIGVGMFHGCSSLRTIALPSELEQIATWAFENAGLETVTIPGSVRTIGAEAFTGCKELKEIIFEDSSEPLKFIEADRYDEYYFDTEILQTLHVGRDLEMDYWQSRYLGRPIKYLQSVTDFRLGDKVTKIEDKIFFGLTSLEKLVIPAGVKSIGLNAFMGFGDTEGKTVECLGSEPAKLDVTAFSEKCYEVCQLIVPEGSEELYKNSEGWSRFYLYKDAGVAEIGDGTVSWSVENGAVRIISGEINEVRVTDLSGHTVYAGSGDVIEVPGHGVYIFSIKGGKGSKVFKISL